jgi:hypothetical protein
MKDANNSMRLVSFSHRSDFVAATIMLSYKDSARLWIKKRMCEDYRPLNLVTS